MYIKKECPPRLTSVKHTVYSIVLARLHLLLLHLRVSGVVSPIDSNPVRVHLMRLFGKRGKQPPVAPASVPCVTPRVGACAAIAVQCVCARKAVCVHARRV